MPKNIKRGKNTKTAVTAATAAKRRELILASEEQQYAKVVRMLGNHRVRCEFSDGSEKLGVIRAKLCKGAAKNGTYISVDDIVIVSLREFQDDKVDIIHLYTPDEVEQLRGMGESVPIQMQHGADRSTILFVVEEEEEEEDKEADVDAKDGLVFDLI